MDELYVLLWSHSQCIFHVERSRDMMKSNLRAWLEDRPMDYVPLFIGAQDDCLQTAAELRPVLLERREVKEKARRVIDAARSRA